MDRPAPAQFTKRDLLAAPTDDELRTAYVALVAHFEERNRAFKIVGGYAVYLHCSSRKTVDLDFVLADLFSTENVVDVVQSMEIPDLYTLGAGGGFGYMVAPGRLVEVDLLDRRFFRAFQLVPDVIWQEKDPLMPLEWMLFVKLRTWKARSLRVPGAPSRGRQGPTSAARDCGDVIRLVHAACGQGLHMSPYMIEETTDIVKSFIDANDLSIEILREFRALGYSSV